MTNFSSYSEIISLENLFGAWNVFKKGKRNKKDVVLFERHLEDNIFQLHELLKSKTYKHGIYTSFYVNDPKRRHIHKACVKDRIIHQILYDYLYPIFNKSFIFNSYSCRKDKGTHKGVKRLVLFTRRVSKNYRRDCWALKLDIYRFFASVDHLILLEHIKNKVKNEDILWLIKQVIVSFETDKGKGIPLGNLTSQIFSNIYLNEFDQFMKHTMKIKYYLRYADDFVIISKETRLLYQCINTSQQFLENSLKLQLHPNKIVLRRLEWGIDFLGYIILPNGVILPRTKTKKRMFNNIETRIKEFYRGEVDDFTKGQTLQSYFGYLEHANSFKIRQKIIQEYI